MLLFSFFNPSIPSLCQEFAKKGVELKIIFTRSSFDSFYKDFRSEGEGILALENVIIYLKIENTIEIPACIGVTENKLLLGLINKKGKFEGQYILSSESSAISWGKELFEYYIEGSRRISSFDILKD